MAVLNLGEVWRVRVFCTDAEQTSINSLYYLCIASAGAGATPQDLASAADAAIGPMLIPCLANTATYKGVGVQRVKPDAVLAELYNGASTGVGTAGAVGLPRQTAGLISWYDGLIGRVARGRTYVPFPAADSNGLQGTPIAGYLVDVDSLALAIATNLHAGGGADTADLQFCLWHRRPLPSPAAPGYATTVDHYVVRSVWATQRRRGSEGRPNSSPV